MTVRGVSSDQCVQLGYSLLYNIKSFTDDRCRLHGCFSSNATRSHLIEIFKAVDIRWLDADVAEDLDQVEIIYRFDFGCEHLCRNAFDQSELFIVLITLLKYLSESFSW